MASEATGAIITCGNLVVDLNAKAVKVGGVLVHLERKEFQVLERLALLKGQGPVPKKNLMNWLYGGMNEPATEVIKVFVSKLRKKLEDAHANCNVGTVRGKGYVLVEPS